MRECSKVGYVGSQCAGENRRDVVDASSIR
jgi:hypothetical protein